MKFLLTIVLITAAAFGQATTQATTPPAAPSPTVATPLSTTVTTPVQISGTGVDVAGLPGITIGIGPAWDRGSANAEAVDTTIAFHLKDNLYSWTDITTPVVRQSPAPNTPIPSTVTTGVCYAVAQSGSGSVTLLTCLQTGFSSSPAGATPVFTGNVAAAFRLGKKPIYIMPYFKAGSPTLGTNGAVASFILQPGAQLLYSFGGK